MICYRVRWKDLIIVECEGKFCKKTRVGFPNVLRVVELFRKNGSLDLIRDGEFLMGGFCEDKCVGKRIDVLPNGAKLCRGFPLFGSDLVIHDERSHGHWDVIFRLPSGEFCYIYSLDKMKLSKDKKFEMVDRFEKCLPLLRKNLLGALGNERIVLAILVLLDTHIRVGGEIYYKRSRHKGLTTLKKKNVKIKGQRAIFDFIGKDGVPQNIVVKFEPKILRELKKVLSEKRLDDFIFLKEDGKIFRDTDFESAFEKFCGERFYPHIVRSHFATREVEKFLKDGKGDAKIFCLDLAGKLGHKKIVNGEWKNSYEVTLHHYVRPDLVEKIMKKI